MEQIIVVPKKKFENLTTKTFEAKIRGKIIKGFVVKKNDRYYAYLNLCKHLPVTLDLNDGNFFTSTIRH